MKRTSSRSLFISLAIFYTGFAFGGEVRVCGISDSQRAEVIRNQAITDSILSSRNITVSLDNDPDKSLASFKNFADSNLPELLRDEKQFKLFRDWLIGRVPFFWRLLPDLDSAIKRSKPGPFAVAAKEIRFDSEGCLITQAIGHRSTLLVIDFRLWKRLSPSHQTVLFFGEWIEVGLEKLGFPGDSISRLKDEALLTLQRKMSIAQFYQSLQDFGFKAWRAEDRDHLFTQENFGRDMVYYLPMLGDFLARHYFYTDEYKSPSFLWLVQTLTEFRKIDLPLHSTEFLTLVLARKPIADWAKAATFPDFLSFRIRHPELHRMENYWGYGEDRPDFILGSQKIPDFTPVPIPSQIRVFFKRILKDQAEVYAQQKKWAEERIHLHHAAFLEGGRKFFTDLRPKMASIDDEPFAELQEKGAKLIADYWLRELYSPEISSTAVRVLYDGETQRFDFDKKLIHHKFVDLNSYYHGWHHDLEDPVTQLILSYLPKITKP